MAYIHVYQGTVTTGGVDGNLVSEGGTGTSPISVTLNATNNQVSSPIKLAIRCDTGYVTSGNTTITPTGTSSTKWALAPDNGGVAGTFGSYGAALTVSSVINATNTIFWAEAKATSDEIPNNDSSTELVVSATIGAA